MKAEAARHHLVRLKDSTFSIKADIHQGQIQVANARKNLGDALCRQRIGIATDNDVINARKNLADAEQSVQDLILIEQAAPKIATELSDSIAFENRLRNEDILAARRREYSEAFKLFDNSISKMVRNNSIEQQGRELFEVARAAKKVPECRKYFRSLGAKAKSLVTI